MITYVALHCHCHPLATRFPPPFPPPSGHFSRGPLASENVESRQSVAIELHCRCRIYAPLFRVIHVK